MANGPSLADRTRLRADPVRNFKFNVQMFHSDPTGKVNAAFAEIGFMSIDGIAMNTEMVAYREGGWNTNPHKLPGQTDFSPLTMSAGVFYTKKGIWELAKRMFGVQWGALTNSIGMGEEFRFDMGVRVLDHPVTRGGESGTDPTAGAVIGYMFYNAWVASVGFSNLNAVDNAVLIHQMTVHHEGFEVFFEKDAITLGDPTFQGTKVPA